MKTAIYTSDAFLNHDTGHNHPESPARIQALHDLFASDFTDTSLKQPRPADIEDIAEIHDESYIYDIMDRIPDFGYGCADTESECILSHNSWDALLLSAGCGLTALEDINHNGLTRAFCAARPPGHHADYAAAMGFCFFNNAFLTAKIAQSRYGFKRPAIIDFDVHHGNGTDALTRRHNAENPNQPIFYASSHQSELWPYSITKAGDPRDNTDYVVNVTLNEGANGKDMLDAYTKSIYPALKAYKPDILILSAGFDAHKDDPLAGLALKSEDFGALTSAIINTSESGIPIISILEGGYEIKALSRCVSAHLTALL